MEIVVPGATAAAQLPLGADDLAHLVRDVRHRLLRGTASILAAGRPVEARLPDPCCVNHTPVTSADATSGSDPGAEVAGRLVDGAGRASNGWLVGWVERPTRERT